MTSKESMDKLDEQIKEFQEEAENYNEMLEESVEDNEDHTKEFTNEEEEYVEEETTKEFDKEEFEEQEQQQEDEEVEEETVEEEKEEPKEEEKKEEVKEEVSVEEKPEEKKKMPKKKKIIISLIVLIVIAIALIIALIISMNKKEEVIEVEREEEYSAKALKKILNNYGKSIENVIAINQTSEEKVLEFEEANKLVEFPNKVICKTHEVYEDGKIYLKDCKIDGHTTKATYGKKQEVKEEVEVAEGSFYVYEKDGTATLDKPSNPDEYKQYLVTTDTTPTEITLLNKYNAKYVFYFDDEQKVQMKNFKTNKNAVVVQGVDSVLPIKNENGFDTTYIGISNEPDSWGIYNLNTGMTEVPLKYRLFTDHLSLGIFGPSLYINSLTDNNIAVRDKDDRIGVINYKTGAEVVPLEYGTMLKSGNYLWKTVIEKDNYDKVLSTAIYDFDGNKYLDNKYDEVYGIVNGKYILVKDKKDVKMVLIDGKELYNYGEIKNLGSLHYSISYNENPLFQLNKKETDQHDDKNCIEVTYDLKTKTGSYKDYTCGGIAKPILYLYPTEQTNVKVTFDHPELLKTTYPKYKGSWDVTVKEDGTITDQAGRNYYALYWDEEQVHKTNFKTGFYVEGKDAIKFLEEKLYEIGLTDREANEFIMYWLPKLEDNKKSLVYFELTKERDSYNKINIEPKPDSLLRLTIHIKKVKKETKIKEQKLTTFVRDGFTAVEWGGVTY